MRKPKLRLVDIRRLWNKTSLLLGASRRRGSLYAGSLGSFHRVLPKVLPWHDNGAVVRFNAFQLRRALTAGVRHLSMTDPVLLTSHPAIVPYLDAIPHGKLAYLRLDDYSLYPGVDPDLVHRTERDLFERADLIFATGRALIPAGGAASKTHYLPQGVQWDHFASTPLEVPESRVLGFFGTLASWLDYELVAAVAAAAPDWELHFVGKVEHIPPGLEVLPNVRLHDPVRFSALPGIISGWRAAWIPFQLNPLTEGVNPLKVREYLAAGLPTHCTPLPEVLALEDAVLVTQDAATIVRWLEDTLRTDSREARQARKTRVRGESWATRSATLRRIISDD